MRIVAVYSYSYLRSAYATDFRPFLPGPGQSHAYRHLAALQQEIERRLTPQHPKLWLNIGKGFDSSLNVSGARNDREKADVMETLEAIWQDDNWFP